MVDVEHSQRPNTPSEDSRSVQRARRPAWLLAVIALTGALVAALFLPASGIAAETDEADKTAKARRPGIAAKRAGLEVAAGTLGIGKEDLRTALKSGRSIADVAEEKEVPTQTVIDAMVAEARSRLKTAVDNGRITQERADTIDGNLPETTKKFVESTRASGMRGRAGRGPGRGPGLKAAAGAIGIGTDDLRNALRSGKSIAEVAQDNGVAPQTVIDAVVDERRTQLQGRLDDLEERIKAMVERKRPTAG